MPRLRYRLGSLALLIAFVALGLGLIVEVQRERALRVRMEQLQAERAVQFVTLRQQLAVAANAQARITQIEYLTRSTSESNSSRHGDDWINSPPEDAFADKSGQQVDDFRWFEIGTSRGTIGALVDGSFAEITPQRALELTGPYYRCPEGSKPYLVRAVYGHAGGRFVVTRDGRKLLVEHVSAGSSPISGKSALIVNLDFKPEAVYTSVKITK
jgi:hypothetical protein